MPRRPNSLLRRLAVCAAIAALGLAACTPDNDDAKPRSLVDPQPVETSDPTVGDDSPALSTALDLALRTVPNAAEYVSFTDVAAVKDRLGYGDLTGESPTSERFEFWERARADGSMLTGTRLYDDSSRMSIDYGWTAEDVSWEVDFSAPEDGCKRSMICDRSNGYILGLRTDLEWRRVLQSLIDNGYTQATSELGLWTTDDPDQPFSELLVITQLHAVASGNELGIRRIGEVVSGSESVASKTSGLSADLGRAESVYLDLTGCVTLGEALGPDATDDDVTDYFKHNDPSSLADIDGYGIGIANNRSAEAVLQLSVPPPDGEHDARATILEGWPGLQSGAPLSQVATTAEITVEPTRERIELDVAAMPAFIAMVLTHDAPWALCATTPPT